MPANGGTFIHAIIEGLRIDLVKDINLLSFFMSSSLTLKFLSESDAALERTHVSITGERAV